MVSIVSLETLTDLCLVTGVKRDVIVSVCVCVCVDAGMCEIEREGGEKMEIIYLELYTVTPQELCESRGGRPGLPVPNSPYGLCGRKATLKNRAQDLCDSRGGRPGLLVPNSPS